MMAGSRPVPSGERLDEPSIVLALINYKVPSIMLNIGVSIFPFLKADPSKQYL